MFKRGFVAASCGALALLLAAAEACPAQVFFSNGRGAGFIGPIISYPVGPNYYPSYYNRPNYSMPYYSSYMQYPVTGPTTLYYGAASIAPAYSYGGYPTARLVSPPAGVGLPSNSQVAAAAYTTPVYPVQSPNYNTIYPVSPPIAAVTDDTARVEVRLPADADLWFEGHQTAQTGTDRSFQSPALQSGQDYVYEVRARWTADGKSVDQTRKVTVHAGDHVVVDFNRQ